MISLPFGLTGSSGTGTEEWHSGVLDIWMALFREAWSARWVEADLEDGGGDGDASRRTPAPFPPLTRRSSMPHSDRRPTGFIALRTTASCLNKRCPAKPSCETPKSEASEHRRFIELLAANIARCTAVEY